VSEVAGPLSSGRTSLALALLACATARGEAAAVVDAADAFDPPSAEAAGVDLDRVLWVRPPGAAQALRSASHLLVARGFAAVVLDLAGLRGGPALDASLWLRLRRETAATDTALVVLCDDRSVQSFADLSLELAPAAVCFEGSARQGGSPDRREAPLSGTPPASRPARHGSPPRSRLALGEAGEGAFLAALVSRVQVARDRRGGGDRGSGERGPISLRWPARAPSLGAADAA
jgi:hypothetical protein